MKKKFLMGVLAIGLAFIGLNGVKADAPAISYPHYGDGSSIYWDNANKMRCHPADEYCKEYIVSGDEDEEDEDIVLSEKNGTEELNMSKISLSSGYILTTTKDTGIYYLYDEQGDRDPSDVDGFVAIQYYDINNDLSDYIEFANYDSDHGKYVYIVSTDNYGFYVDGDITINKNVAIYTSMLAAHKIINNGKIAAAAVSSDEITGNGHIVLDYRVPSYAPTGFEADYLALRLAVNKISGVTVDVKGQIKDGVQFGFAGMINSQYVENITKENAQKIIDMLNNVKGSTLKGYKVVLKEFTDKPSGIKMYIGVLEKETVSEQLASAVSNIKKVVKNPKTGDTLFTILGGILLAGSVFVVTVKKAKQK